MLADSNSGLFFRDLWYTLVSPVVLIILGTIFLAVLIVVRTRKR